MREWWWREPGAGAYARTEREWRWLLPAVPADVSTSVDIEDGYLYGTMLRLRQMHGAAGDVFKLTQKVRLRVDDPSVNAVTNIYLTARAHSHLAAMPSDLLTKRRHRWSVEGHGLAVDEMLGRWRGLVLAELEHDEAERMPAVPRGVEVSNDGRFAGGALAATADHEVPDVLDAVRRLVSG
jgi:CYTH domain-containing protein